MWQWRLYKRARREGRLLANGRRVADYVYDTADLLRPSLWRLREAMPGAEFTMKAVGEQIIIEGAINGKTASLVLSLGQILDAANGYDGGYTGLMRDSCSRMAPQLNFIPIPSRKLEVQYEHVQPTHATVNDLEMANGT